MGIDCVIQTQVASWTISSDACPLCKLFLAVLKDTVNDHDYDYHCAILNYKPTYRECCSYVVTFAGSSAVSQIYQPVPKHQGVGNTPKALPRKETGSYSFQQEQLPPG